VASLDGKVLEDCDGLMEDMEVTKILRWWLGVSLVKGIRCGTVGESQPWLLHEGVGWYVDGVDERCMERRGGTGWFVELDAVKVLEVQG